MKTHINALEVLNAFMWGGLYLIDLQQSQTNLYIYLQTFCHQSDIHQLNSLQRGGCPTYIGYIQDFITEFYSFPCD